MAKLSPNTIQQIRNAISKAKTLDEIERLEDALHTGNIDPIMDLISTVSQPLLDVWQPTKRKEPEPNEEKPNHSEPTSPVEPPSKRTSVSAPLVSKTSTVALSLLYDKVKHDPQYPQVTAGESSWRSSSECSGVGGLSTIAIECGTAICMHEGSYVHDVLIRLVAIDFDTENVLLDMKVKLPEGYTPVDTRSDFTGMSEEDLLNPSSDFKSFEDARQSVLSFLKGPETLIVCHSALKSAHALKLKHPKWLSLSLLFKVSERSKKSADFHVRQHLAPYQLRQALLGEAANNWASETIDSVCRGSIRLVKISCSKFPKMILDVDVPRSPDSLWVQKIPRDFSQDQVAGLFGPACSIDKITWKFEPSETDWLGECKVTFVAGDELKARETRDTIFDMLPILSDIYVSWELQDHVTEEILKSAASKFGKVIGTRIPSKSSETGRPFGFVSFLMADEANKMGEAKRIKHGNVTLFARPSQGADASRKTTFKRVPLENKILEIYKL